MQDDLLHMSDQHLSELANQTLEISVGPEKGRKKQEAVIPSPCSKSWKPYELYTEVGIYLGGGYEMSP